VAPVSSQGEEQGYRDGKGEHGEEDVHWQNDRASEKYPHQECDSSECVKHVLLSFSCGEEPPRNRRLGFWLRAVPVCVL
jgi:hypothetical protein